MMKSPLSNHKKKAQAAMEFLMTYGWAILVVLIVIGALAYFGVLSPSTLLPEKCTFPVSMSCTDFSVANGDITFILLNGAGRDMNVWHVNASSDALGAGPCSNALAPAFVRISNGATGQFVLGTVAGTDCPFANKGRDKNRYIINLSYSWTDSPSIKHNLAGELLAKGP